MPTATPARDITKGLRMEEFPYAWASAWGEDTHGIWVAFTLEGVRQVMRWIPPGKFMMGSVDDPDKFDDENPHEVRLTRGFWLGETTVTQALWQVVMGSNPSHFKGEDLPVDSVSWEDAVAFTEKLEARFPGFGARLPSEAEWEYACRAGTVTPFSFGPSITPDQVNHGGNLETTVPVKSLPCNEWGLYEMHGNLWEWCADWYGAYDLTRLTDPTGPESGQSRVLRGGSWFYYAGNARSAYRYCRRPGDRYEFVGFRLARGC